MTIADSKAKKYYELTNGSPDPGAAQAPADSATGPHLQDPAAAQRKKKGQIFAEGVLEILPDDTASCARPDTNYLPGPGRHLRVAIANPQVRLGNTGDTISGQVRPPHEGEKYFCAVKIRGGQFRVARRGPAIRFCSTT